MPRILDDPTEVGLQLGHLLVEQNTLSQRQHDVAVGIIDCQIALMHSRLQSAKRTAAIDGRYEVVRQVLARAMTNLEREREKVHRQTAPDTSGGIVFRSLHHLVTKIRHTHAA